MDREPIEDLVFERRMVWDLALVRMHREGGTLRECLTWAVQEMAGWEGDPVVRLKVDMQVHKQGKATDEMTAVVAEVVLHLTAPLHPEATDKMPAHLAHDFSSVPFSVVSRFWPDEAPPLSRGSQKRR